MTTSDTDVIDRPPTKALIPHIMHEDRSFKASHPWITKGTGHKVIEFTFMNAGLVHY